MAFDGRDPLTSVRKLPAFAGAATGGLFIGRAARSDGVRALLRVLPRVWPLGTVAFAGLIVVRGILSVAYLPAVGALVAGVAATAHGAGTGPVVASFAALAAIRLAELAAIPVATVLNGTLGRRVTRFTNGAVLGAAFGPVGTGHLEDPRFADRMSLAQGVGTGTFPPSAAVPALSQVVTSRIAGLASAVLLARVIWWAPLPLALSWYLSGRWLGSQMRDTVRRFQGDTLILRRAAYLRELAIDGSAAKELRVFGLGAWLVQRFTETWSLGMAELLHRNGGQARAAASARAALLLCTYGAVFGTLAADAANGVIGVAQLSVAVQAAFAMASLGWAGDAEWQLTGASEAIPHAVDMARAHTRPEQDLTAATALRGHEITVRTEHNPPPVIGIRFESVTFRYPGRSAAALDGLDLVVPAGSSIALVGDNGAGKTTLVKLLARCHDPDAGKISVDGADLRDLDPHMWRRSLAVVFQDFVRFELSARDNVRFGRVEDSCDIGELHAAARLAGAEDLIDALPDGWDTMLSRRYPGGAELSGGQWQRLALARGLLAVQRGAQVLVLDEPTAQLDVRAETELYERLPGITSGITTILISHRFSTVRSIPRICVLSDGRITEQGTHAELLDLNGRYARMFQMQAERFAGGRHA